MLLFISDHWNPLQSVWEQNKLFWQDDREEIWPQTHPWVWRFSHQWSSGWRKLRWSARWAKWNIWSIESPQGWQAVHLLSTNSLRKKKRGIFSLIKSVLYTAFAMDGLLAYEQFAEQHLHPGELVDIYLAEILCSLWQNEQLCHGMCIGTKVARPGQTSTSY